MSDLVFLPAHALAQGIRDRTFSASEVLEAHLTQIAEHNPQVNAIATLNEVQARQQAIAADAALATGELWGSLHGVPITVKDNVETAGLRTTASYPPLANYSPQQDATTVARLRAAGAIVLAKTNLPKLAAGLQTNSPLFGRTHNPWNLAYTCGGSTGGGGAAVAAGFSPLELGNDGAGSIRIPAHFCGVYGFKPTEHRVSMAGQIPPLPGKTRSLRYQLCPGVLARSVTDLRLWLLLVEGPDGRHWEIPPVNQTEATIARSLQEYRFAWTDNFGDVPITVETRESLEKIVLQLSQLGCQVKQLTPPNFNFDQAWQVFGEIAATELYSKSSTLGLVFHSLLSRLPLAMIPGGPLTRGFIRGAGLSLPRTSHAMALRDQLITALEVFLEQWDVWLCPVCPRPAFPHCWTGKLIEVDNRKLSYLVGGCAYTAIFNLTGNPVVVLPVSQTKAGLPIGIQVVGKRWQDHKLLAIAQALTQVTGEFKRPPGY